MKQKLIHNTIDAVIRKKLENIVLDTMEHPEEVPENILEYMEIAREKGFYDIIEGFNEILSEVGKIQVGRTVERKRNQLIRRDEKEFQDYLIANPEKLEEIEKGLKYLSHEKVTRAGRLDIETKDKDNRLAKVELKARDYDSRNVFMQIMKYFNDDETGEGRLIFTAPEIKNDLFFALRQYQEAGKMKFIEFDKTNGDYSFREINASDFEVPKEINWSKRKRKQIDNGLVRVTAAVGKSKQPKEKLEKEKESEDESEDEFPDEIASKEWESYPLYYQVLFQTRPNIKNPKSYLDSKELGVDEFDNINRLGFSFDLENILRDYEEQRDWYIDEKNRTQSINDVRSKICWPPYSKNPKKAGKILEKGFSKDEVHWNKARHLTHESLLGMENVNNQSDEQKNSEEFYKTYMGFLIERKESIDELRKEINTDIDKFMLLDFLNKAIKKAPKGREGDIVRAYINDKFFRSEYYKEKMFSSYLELKVKRAEELLKIDKQLGLSYLYFGPKVGIMLKKGEATPHSWRSDAKNIYKFIRKDNEVYQSILSNFKMDEKELNSYPLFYQILLKNMPNLENKKRYLTAIEITQDKKQELEDLIEPKGLMESTSELEKHISWYIPPEEAQKISNVALPGFKGDLEKGISLFKKGFGVGQDYNNQIGTLCNLIVDLTNPECVFNREQGFDFEERLNLLKGASNKLDKLIVKGKYQDEFLTKFREFLKKGIKEINDTDDKGKQSKKYLQNLLYLNSFYNSNAINNFCKTKIKRAEALRQIDNNLALSYLTFHPYEVNEVREIVKSQKQIDSPIKVKEGTLTFDNDSKKYVLKFDLFASGNFIEEDKKLYESILSNFKLIPKESPLETEVKTEPILEIVEKPAEPRAPIYMKKNSIVKAIVNKHSYNLSEDQEARIDNFAQDILDKYKSDEGKVRQIYYSLLHFGFDRNIRNRDKLPSDVQLRNFFDDLMLGYINQDKIPESKDLEILYRENCTGEEK